MKLINIGFGNLVSQERLVAHRQPGFRTHQAKGAGDPGARYAH